MRGRKLCCSSASLILWARISTESRAREIRRAGLIVAAEGLQGLGVGEQEGHFALLAHADGEGLQALFDRDKGLFGAARLEQRGGQKG